MFTNNQEQSDSEQPHSARFDFHAEHSFVEDFYAPTAALSDLKKLREGTYVDLTRADFKKFAPEGFAGDTGYRYK